MTNREEITKLRDYLSNQIIGQTNLIDQLLVALLADGHLLVEGAPGLAKTRAIKVLAEGIIADFQRIQFTPDLLPADLTGTDIFRPQEGTFNFQAGPLFHNLILADEVNRAPAKVQSALLEAMAEHQITVGSKTYDLPRLFLVMATQNPIEQEGTYPLPEAQLDRFLMHVRVDYPDASAEKAILKLAREEAQQHGLQASPHKVSQDTLFSARDEVLSLHLAENLEEYLLQIVLATRSPAKYNDQLREWIQYGASPRASVALDRCSRAYAYLNNRDFVTPEDIQTMAYSVLRHRIILSYEAEADGITPDKYITELLKHIAVP